MSSEDNKSSYRDEHVEEQIQDKHVDLDHNVNAKLPGIQPPPRTMHPSYHSQPRLPNLWYFTRARSTMIFITLIANPLHGIPRHKLLSNVEKFTQAQGFDGELELFQKAALVAQNPSDFESIDLLTEEDKGWLRRETTNRWDQPMALYLTVGICSIAAAVQGWDQTGSNGANLSFPKEFNIDPDCGCPDAQKNQWLVGLVNSGPYIGSWLLGCWITDPLNNYFGRRGTIFVCGIFCTISVIGSAVTQNWYQLFITRLLLGVGMGAKASTVPVFAAENTPASIRGGLVMSWQLWTAFGIFLGFCANLILFQVGDIAWRLQLGSAFLPAVPLVLFIYLCPESPRWYMKKGRFQDAFRSFKRLRNSELQAARDLYYVYCQLEEERAVMEGRNFFTRAKELFTIPRVRRATLASWVVMIAQQMCGINIIAFYSSNIFVNAGYSAKKALLLSFGFGAVNFAFAFPAVWTIDTFGRRNLLLFTFPNMAWCLLAAGFSFYIPNNFLNSDGTANIDTRISLIVFFIFLFAAFYSPGEGPVPFTYSAEVFPLTHREIGMSWAVATCLFWASVLSVTFPRMLDAMGAPGAFGFYAGLNMVAFVMIFFLVPGLTYSHLTETKQRTLEELDYVFAVPTARHASYQLNHTAPYFIKRWIFFQKDAKLEELYDFSEVTYSVIGSAVTQNWYQLFITRLLLGVGMGAKASTVPTAFGIFLGFCANLILFQVGDIAWRLQLGSAFLPAVPLVLFIYLCPESPRWYMKKGRFQDAFRSFKRLRNSELQAARDLYYVYCQLEEERAVMEGRNFFTRAKELFTIPRVRRATLASWVVMIAQQMCGINIIAFYSSNIFVNAGYSAKKALLLSFGFGAVNFAFAFPAVWTIDTFGRRNLLLFTFPNMAWCLLAAGFSFYIPNNFLNSDGTANIDTRISLIVFFIFLFAAFYSPGEGPVPFTYSAEVFPLTHREIGMSWAVATCLFWASVLSVTFPRMLDAMGAPGAFGFYAGLNMVAFVMIFFLVPGLTYSHLTETKQRTLEELDYVFAVPTARHASYQLNHTAPYFIKRWIFFQKDAKLEELYDFSEVTYSGGGIPEAGGH
ncbi:general substrate transporter [Clavulina sp. PMI_390]|nr:general substrate transporter [Clavulina sp. PMI_390]